jgi:hypothetical protein
MIRSPGEGSLQSYNPSHQPYEFWSSSICHRCLIDLGTPALRNAHLRRKHGPYCLGKEYPQSGPLSFKYPCPQCTTSQLMFDSSKACKDHIKQDHEAKKTILCGFPISANNNCTLRFRTLKARRVHFLASHLGGEYPCEEPGCTEVFRTKSVKRSHLQTHHPSVKKKLKLGIKCSKCSFIGQFPWQIRLHELETHRARQPIVVLRKKLHPISLTPERPQAVGPDGSTNEPKVTTNAGRIVEKEDLSSSHHPY